ncbi:hypothetical protein [Ectopseudomonas khazarica]|uniref:hypothetical protein n=1 Tax=Ectopseudomonas khazarica TaxID=2502979 RepID=UPI003B95E173
MSSGGSIVGGIVGAAVGSFFGPAGIAFSANTPARAGNLIAPAGEQGDAQAADKEEGHDEHSQRIRNA